MRLDTESAEYEELRASIRAADGSPAALREIFENAIEQLGRARASAMWWAAFGAEDAAQT